MVYEPYGGGAAAMSLSSFCVCMNALRLNLFKVTMQTGDRHGKGEVSETKLNSLIRKVTGNDESSDEPGQSETKNLHEDN